MNFTLRSLRIQWRAMGGWGNRDIPTDGMREEHLLGGL